MRSEQLLSIEQVNLVRSIITHASSGALLYFLTTHAFQGKVRNAIKERSKGCCEDCGNKVGKQNLTASHTIHGTGSLLNRVENGTARCGYCEAAYHLVHVDSPSDIGLNRQNNLDSITSNIRQLGAQAQAQLQRAYPEQWARWENKRRH